MASSTWAYRWGGGSWRMLTALAVLEIVLAGFMLLLDGSGTAIVLGCMAAMMAFTAGARYERDVRRRGVRSRAADFLVRPESDERLRGDVG